MSEVSLKERYKRSSSVVGRRIADEAVLVPIRKNVSDLSSIFALNETAALAWDMWDGQNSLQVILEKITAEFEVDEAVAARDLLALAARLLELDAIEKV